MPAVTRELLVAYGSFQCGGSTDRIIDGHTRMEDAYANAYFEFYVIVRGTTEAAFAAACTAIEAAYRKPRQDLVVTQGAATLLSLKQSDNTGFDGNPVITKAEHMVDTGRSRRYTIRIEFGRPADNLSLNGLRYSTVQTAYGENRRRSVTVSGTWTAVPTTGTAWSQYNANVDAWALTQLQVVEPNTNVSIYWELIEQPRAEYNSSNKTIEFSRTYKEKVYPDAGATTAAPDDPDLVNQQFKVGWVAEGPGDSPGSGVDHSGGSGGSSFSTGSGGVDTGVMQGNPGTPPGQGGAPTARLGKIVLHWEASVDKTRTIDTKSKYNNTIRPWCITEAVKVMAAGYSNPALVMERYDLDRDDNRVIVDMEFWCIGPANIIEQRVTTTESKPSYGWVLVPRWDGQPLSKFRYQGPAQQLRIVKETRRVYQVTADVLGKEPQASNSQVPVARDVAQTKVNIGIPGGAQILVTDIEIMTIIEFFSGGSGSSTPTTPVSSPGDNSVATQSPGTNFFPSGGGGGSVQSVGP